MIDALNISQKDIPPKTVIIGRKGRVAEQKFLGFTLRDEIDLYYPPEEYLPFWEAFREMSETQFVGYNPANPREGCNKQFFESVQKHLHSKDELRYFIAVNTRMDFFHGADAVFSWKGIIITIDVTVDPNKECKADFRVLYPDDIKSGYVYDVTAKNIAMMFKSRLNASRG